MAADRKEIDDLREQIRRHDALYYVEGRPEISDGEYDGLFARLKELEAAHPDWITPDSPTQRVGGAPLEGFKHVTHAVPMLSIDNTYDEADLREFDGRVAKGLGGEPYEYYVDPKVDGVSASLRYEDGLLVLGATRGDGRTGDDVTANIKTIRAVPLRLRGDDWPRVLEVRGEVFWPRKPFDAFNRERVKQNQEPFANPRNATTGTLKSLDSRAIASRGLSFVAHGFGEIVGASFDTAADVFKAFKRWGIPVSPHGKLCGNVDAVIRFIDSWDKQRGDIGYETDGLVIKVNNLDQRDALGATSRYPRWCIAYKYAAEQAESLLKSVDFQVGKLGTITPRAVMEPVQLSGTTVRHASLHNFDQIERLDVRIGDTVIVQKAGEIIPQVVRVVTEKRPKGAKRITPPKQCPVCGGEVAKDEGGVYIRCINPSCKAQLKERLKYFCGRDQMDIEGAGESLIDRLVDDGLLRDLVDLYHLPKHRAKLAALDFPTELGERSADSLLAAITRSAATPLGKTLVPLAIPFLSGPIVSRLASHFGSISELADATVNEIGKIDGVDKQQAKSIADYFNPKQPEELAQSLTELHERRRFRIAQLGPARIERLTESGLLRVFGDLFRLSDRRNELVSLTFPNRFGDKKTDRLLEGIKKSLDQPLSRVLAALNIRHVGNATAVLLAEHFESIDDLLRAGEKTIRSAIGGQPDTAAGKLARTLHLYFSTPRIPASLDSSSSSFRTRIEALRIPCFVTGEQIIDLRINQLATRFSTLSRLGTASVRDMTIAMVPPAEKKVAKRLRSFLGIPSGTHREEDLQDEDLEKTLRGLEVDGLKGTTRPAERRRALARRFGGMMELRAASQQDMEEALASDAERRTAQDIHDFLESNVGLSLFASANDQTPLDKQLKQMPVESLQAGKKTLDKRVPQLEEFFGDLPALIEASEEDIREALSEERAIASSIYRFLQQGAGRQIIQNLKSVGMSMRQPKVAVDRQLPLAGKIVVVTGTMQGQSRSDIQKMIQEMGGRPSGSVSKKTDFVIAGDQPGSKLEKARKLGIKVLDVEKFLRLVGRGSE